MDNTEIDNLLDPIMRRNIITDYFEAEKHSIPIGFNIFPTISDSFYKENFHSDILKAFLSTNSQPGYVFGQHCDGDLYLQIFIDMVNVEREARNLPPIDGELYSTAVVEREPHRIDILIKGEKHCIIIENKINDAPDMERQLPRYCEIMRNEGYEVDAIVYLTKTPEMFPDVKSWSPLEKRDLLPYITIIPANDEDGKVSLLNSWIKSCCSKAKDPICESVLQQYGALIEYLTPNFKKSAAMKELLKYLQEQSRETVKDVFIFAKMMQELDSEMARSLHEKVTELISSKGLRVESWSQNSCVINLGQGDNVIWIYCYANENNAYHLGFRGIWKDGNAKDYTVSWYPEKDVKVSIDINGAYLSKDFKFGEKGEKELLKFIDKLIGFAAKGNIIG